jgi:hypothetical protein
MNQIERAMYEFHACFEIQEIGDLHKEAIRQRISIEAIGKDNARKSREIIKRNGGEFLEVEHAEDYL